MALIDDTLSDMMNDEGLRLQVYDDATGRPLRPHAFLNGHPTIGYGRALDVKGISKSEALYLLTNDISSLIVWCNANLDFFKDLNEARQRVVINMCFQMGEGGFLSFHDLVGAIETENWQAAHDAMLNSDWARETSGRANTLANWMLTGSA